MPNLEFVEEESRPTRIKVVGVGGGGSNAVDSMIDMGLKGVDFCNINTDSQALDLSSCPNKLHIGDEVTLGMGCGGDPALGEKAAQASEEQIAQMLEDCDMVFIAAGLGGGTGTGAAPVVAEIAKNLNLLTVAIVTKPFAFEGPQRHKRSELGLRKLSEFVDTKIVILNDKLIDIVGPKTPITEAFSHVNRVLAQGVQAISELISIPGEINVDFMDVRTIMGETGGAVMGVGLGKGENRSTEAVKKACSSPLQEKIVIEGARGVLISIAASKDVSLQEVNTATSMVYEMADPDANIIFGLVIDPEMKDEFRVTIIATGFPDEERRFGKKQDASEQVATANTGMDLETKLKTMMAPEPESSEDSRTQKKPAQERPTEAEKPRPAPRPEPREAERKPAAVRPKPRIEPAPENTQPSEPKFDFWEEPQQEKAQEPQSPAMEPQAEPEPAEVEPKEDIETPAYLRRRKPLFE